jgi:hypothetical protein
MSIHLRYELGRLLRKRGYGMTREYRWPAIHGNLLLPRFSLVRSRHHELIQILEIAAFDGQVADPLADDKFAIKEFLARL